MLSSAGCWKVYGDVLAREYQDISYWAVHRLTVDTYAAQHPFNEDKRNVRSVNIHLMTLYGVFELERPHKEMTEVLKKASKTNELKYSYLKPPKQLGQMTIQDVALAKNAKEHCKLVEDWSRSVWKSWTPHLETIKNNFQRIDS